VRWDAVTIRVTRLTEQSTGPEETDSMATSPSEFFTAKAEQIKSGASALDGFNALYQFNLSGDDGGTWIIELTADRRDVRQGEDENAQCVINMTSTDFMAMVGGSLNPQMAFMTGKLKVKGDMGLALKLQTILT
jgi:putative sterol carrier protein